MLHYLLTPHLILLFLFSTFLSLPDDEKITVYLIGDSTVSEKEVIKYPETGWGMPFRHYFDSTVTVDNRAKNGRSSRTFVEEGLWEPIVRQLKEGDYVLIQFGHNDEVPTKASSTTPEQFKAYLLQYIKETREKKATPVLITPAVRRSFDASGNVVDTHAEYSPLVSEVASGNNVPLIDLDRMGQELLQTLGPEESTYLWLHLSEGENPHYPNGIVDNTHFNELGARKMAELVLKEIEKLELDLAKRIR